jgi:hypothetical protein
LAVRFFILNIRLTIQAKKPASFKRAIRTIIPTRNRITSKEENFIKFSKSRVRVINRTDTPRKAKLKRKSQKKSVPNIDAENIEIAMDCRQVKPITLVKIPKLKDINIRIINFLAIF